MYINGKDITKGFLAPYISNPEDFVYYDLYEVTEELKKGDNVIVVILGNGFSNSNDNNIWEFEKATFRDAPKLNISLKIKKREILTTEDFFVKKSPITFDDLRCGERYDANLEDRDLFLPFFNDDYIKPIKTQIKGEYKECKAEPVVVTNIIKPISVTKSTKGYIFDFGKCLAGVCKLKINGKKGQEISLTYSEMVCNNNIDLSAISFDFPPNSVSVKGYVQHDVYTCKEGWQEYVPYFTYHGFRYCEVIGIEEKDIQEDFLLAQEITSLTKNRASFTCNNEVINKIQQCALNSARSNFVYIVTDCPQREKNGWTSEAQVCTEYFLYNYDCVASLKEWLSNIRKAQRDDGAIPGIIPTSGWGFKWGNGPQWDKIIVEMPLNLYKFTNDIELLKENVVSIKKYVNYLISKIKENNLLEFGLPDWCVTGEKGDGLGATSLEITDSLLGVDILRKAKKILLLVSDNDFIDKIENSEELIISAFKKKYIIDNKITEDSQTAQSIAIMLGLFDDNKKALNHLKEIIKKNNNHIHVGVMGYKYLFDVLALYDEMELAYKLITQETWPSYGNLICQGATSLWEKFTEYYETDGGIRQKDGGWRNYSLNHSAFGGISAWFYKYLAGINIESENQIIVSPKFVDEIDNIESEFSNYGKTLNVKIIKNNNKRRIFINNDGFDCKFIYGDIEKTVKKYFEIEM